MAGPRIHGASLLKASLVEITGSFPSNPIEGQLCYKDNDLYIYIIDGEIQEWRQLSDSNAYIQLSGSSNISGHLIPNTTATYNLGSSSNTWNEIHCEHLYTSGNSIYVAGTKVVGVENSEVILGTDSNRFSIGQIASGNISAQSSNNYETTADGSMNFNVTNIKLSKHVDFTNQSVSGDIAFTSVGTNAAIQLFAEDEIDLQAATIYMVGTAYLNGNKICTEPCGGGTVSDEIIIDFDDEEPGYLYEKIKTTSPYEIDKIEGGDGIIYLTSLVSQYFFNESDGSTIPTEILDQRTLNAVNLNIDYEDYNPTFFSHTSGRGIYWPNLWERGWVYSNSIDGTKIESKLNFTTTFTFEIICDITSAASWQPLLSIYGSDVNIGFRLDGNGVIIPVYNGKDAGYIPADLESKGLCVIQMVYNSEESLSENRIKFYINGVRIGFSDAWDLPDQDEYIQLNSSDVLLIGSTPYQWSSHQCKIYYVCLYDVALDSTQCNINKDRLLIDNDSNPAYIDQEPKDYLLIKTPTYHYVSDDLEMSTSSTSWQPRTNLNFEVETTGLFRIGWSVIFTFNSTNGGGEVQILVNSILIDQYYIEPQDQNNKIPISGFCIRSLNTGLNDILIQYRCSRNGRSVTLYNARIEAQRVG